MTVEQLIEMLQREYPQSLILIEHDKPLPSPYYGQILVRAIAEPYALRPESRTGAVHILCGRHDC